MGCYLSNYEHDIFVSYSHIDNEVFHKIEDGWVSTFTNILNKKLSQDLGTRDFSLWRDHRLSAHEELTPELVSIVENSALLLVIVSNAYLNSEWCQKERKTFINKVKNKIFPTSRIFIIEIDNIEIEKKPEELLDITGYKFWYIDEYTGKRRLLGFPEPKCDDTDYYQRIIDLSYDLAKILNKLKEQ